MDATRDILVDGYQLYAFVSVLLWTSLRVGAALMAAPILGTPALPARIRLILTLAIAAALAPMLPTPPAAGVNPETVLSIARELAIGVAIGFLLRLAFEAGVLAGELVAQGMGLAFAQMADPLRGNGASGLVGQWFTIALILLFFAFDGHLALIELIASSYHAAPVGVPLQSSMALLSAPSQFMNVVLISSVRMALPVILAMLVVNISLGVLARTSPSLNPMQIGFPAALFVGVLLLGVLTGELLEPARQLFAAAFAAAAAIFT